MIIKFWSLASSNGDGSSSTHLFKTQEAAQAYCNKLEEIMGGPNEDENISSEELEIDDNTGEILTPDPVLDDLDDE